MPAEFTDIGFTIGWIWIIMLTILFLGVGIPLIFAGLWIRNRSINNYRYSGDDGFGTWSIGTLLTIVGAIFAVVLFGFMIVAGTHNQHNFSITGKVLDVTNTGIASDGDVTFRTYVIDLDSTETVLVTVDPRATTLIGKTASFTCTPDFVFRGQDRVECVIASTQ